MAGGGSPALENSTKGWRRRRKIDLENVVADGNRGGTGGDRGYGRIAGREVVMVVPIRWPWARRRLIGGESKWRRRNSKNSKS